MKIIIEHDALLKAVSGVTSVVERRNTVPILGNVLLEAEGNQILFRASDMDVEVTSRVTAEVEQVGRITVSAKTLHEIIRKLPDGVLVTMVLDEQKGRLVIQARRSKFSLATMPGEDFPIMASSEYSVAFSISGAVLHEIFNRLKFAISNDDSRYYLNGIYMHVTDEENHGVLRFVSTDGHRLGSVAIDLPSGAENMPSVIIPRKTVMEMLKIPKDSDTEIEVSASKTKIRFTGPGFTLVSKVIDGVFPEYSKAIPNDNNREMEVDADEFVNALDRVGAVVMEKNRGVILNLENNRLVITVEEPGFGTSREELPVNYNDESLQIGFNIKFSSGNHWSDERR